jgi:minor curlin subunit
MLAALTLATSASLEANDDPNHLLNSGTRISQYISESDQAGLKSNVSIIRQQGNNNKASIAQSRSLSYQLANFAYINQLGNGNQANIVQSNGNNVGIIGQIGDDNTASINQQGNNISFNADIYQSGFKGDVSISQSGSGLRGVSVQQQNYSGNARPVTIDTY